MKFYNTKIILFFLIFSLQHASATLQDMNDVNSKGSRDQFYGIIKYYEEEIKKDPHNLKLILAVAEVYYSLKEYDKAVEYYQKGLALDPQNTKIKTELALAYLNNNDLVHSQELLDQLIKLDPNNLDVLGGLGRIEALKHHLPQAENFYKKVLLKDPNHFTTLFYLGELKIEQKNYIEAQSILKKLLEEDPQATWVKQALKRAELGPQFEKIARWEEREDYQSAVLLYKQLLAKDPDNLELYLGLGKLYTKMKHFSEAINLLNDAQKRYPSENSLRLALGFTYLAKNDLVNAEFFLIQALKSGSGQSEALAGLGRIAALQGHLSQAEKLYQKSISLNPFDTLALSYLAQLRMDEKQYEQAQQLYEKILLIDPKALWAKQSIDEAQLAPLLEIIHQEENKNNFAEAEKLYQQILNKFPTNVNNYIRFAKFYRNQKRYQQAIDISLRGLKINPKAMPLYINLANDYLLIGELEQSQKIFQFVLDNEPFNTEALAGLGRIDSLIGDPANAANFYELALKINPQEMTALSYLVDLEMEEKNYDAAQKLLNKIIKIDPKARWAQQMLPRAKYGKRFDEIKALETAGDLHSALIKYLELLNLAPESEDVYLGLGHIYNTMKRYPEAVQIYKKGLQLNPSATQLMVNLGLTYMSMNELKKAKHQLQLAYKIDTKNVDAIAGLGRIASIEGNQEEALKAYQTALNINPNNLLALSYLADFWMKEKQFAKAQKIYEKIIQLAPNAIWARIAVEEAKLAPVLLEGTENENKKNYADAETIYLELIEEAPNSAEYYIKLGQLYVKMKRYKEAIVLYQKGLHLLPESTELKISLAYVYLAKSELDIAKNIFDIILKNDPENPEALAGIGRYYELLGQTDKAIVWYHKALKIDPNNITTLVYLSQLMFDTGNYDYAQKLYGKIYALQPDSEWIKIAMEDAKHGRLINQIKKEENAGNFIAAETLWKQLLLEAPNIGDYYLRFGLFYHKIKQYEKAIDTYMKGLQVDPKSAELYAALGLVYLSKKNYSEAQIAFKHAFERDPKNPDALAGLGYIAMINRDYKKSESLIKAALTVDPNRIAALSSLGELWMNEKRYTEAQKVYEKLLILRPKDKWVKLSLDDARFGTELEKIKALMLQEQYAEAAQIYEYLLTKSPDNPHYYFGLGQMYMRLKQYEQSIQTNLIGLEKNPDENSLRVALGYAYFFNNNLQEARDALSKALAVDSKDPEALAGLGRVNALEENYCNAEALYVKALTVDPKNQSALSFFGDLLMKQKRYSEAQDMFARLSMILPDALWVQRSWQDAVDGPLTDIANQLADREEFELAAKIYRQLIEASPDDPARYLPLGQMYVNLQDYCCGIRIFQQGLMIDPEAWYLWRAIGFAYILMEDYCTSQNIFAFLTDQDPDDAESWAGLGRIQALNGSICLAEQYYATALEISAKNLLALSFLADLRTDEQFNFSAAQIYDTIDGIVESNMVDPCQPKPKWVLRGYHNALNLACPTISVGGFFHEEDQWDPTIHQWSAEYLVYGGKALLNYPICDELTIWGSAADQFYSLRDLITRKSIYSFDVQRFYLGAKWVYSPCFFVEAKAGLTNFSPYRHSNFRMLKGNIAEPTLSFVYHEPIQKASLSFTSGSDLVARNFKRNVAKIVGYYFIAGTYERKIIRRGWIGFEADAFWYNDFVHNNSQRAIGWFQWRPPCYSDNIIFRYYVKYQTFAKNIPDYYTYKPQIVNQLQLTLEKYWRVCWADTFYTSFSYGHGWQDTHTRFAQIIVVDPLVTPTTNPPFIWDRRQFDIVFGSIIYKYDQLQLTFAGDYYRDTEKYTIWSIAGDLVWRF